MLSAGIAPTTEGWCWRWVRHQQYMYAMSCLTYHSACQVRAGTGGDEASLFSGELFKMYEKLCGRQGWRWELLSLSKTDIGGFKEATAVISGELVYKTLKFESGVHRVQRIPVNDTKIQTSAASVVVRHMCPAIIFDVCGFISWTTAGAARGGGRRHRAAAAGETSRSHSLRNLA